MVIALSGTAASAIPVVCAIIEREECILAACRQEQQTNGGLWEFPGGKVEDGETLDQALARELREELEITVDIGRQLPAVSWKYPWIHIHLHPFVVRLNDNRDPVPLDHAALRYVTPSEALTLVWAPADRKIVEEYLVSVGKPLNL